MPAFAVLNSSTIFLVTAVVVPNAGLGITPAGWETPSFFHRAYREHELKASGDLDMDGSLKTSTFTSNELAVPAARADFFAVVSRYCWKNRTVGKFSG